MELEDEGLEGDLTAEHEQPGTAGTEQCRRVSQNDESEDEREAGDVVVLVVDKLAFQAEFEPKVPHERSNGCSDSTLLHRGEPRFVGDSVLCCLDVRIGREHATIDDVDVESDSEIPFPGRPYDAEYVVQDLEKLFVEDAVRQKKAVQAGRDCKLAEHENGLVVVLVANDHGKVDDEVPRTSRVVSGPW